MQVSGYSDELPPTMSNRDAPHSLVVEVCTHPECMTCGAGAALLEIEELACELHEAGICVHVERAACQRRCASGPVVKIFDNTTGTPSQAQFFSNVDNSNKCYEILQSILSLCKNDSDKSLTNSSMERRAEGLRWNALKTLARNPAKPDTGPLEEALAAEFAAACSVEKKLRVQRRATHLSKVLGQPLVSASFDCCGL